MLFSAKKPWLQCFFAGREHRLQCSIAMLDCNAPRIAPDRRPAARGVNSRRSPDLRSCARGGAENRRSRCLAHPRRMTARSTHRNPPAIATGRRPATWRDHRTPPPAFLSRPHLFGDRPPKLYIEPPTPDERSERHLYLSRSKSRRSGTRIASMGTIPETRDNSEALSRPSPVYRSFSFPPPDLTKDEEEKQARQ